MSQWYKELVALHKELGHRGLECLAFPCNQFGMQEPGGAAEVEACVRAKYHVDFHVFEKVKVNGADTHPVYRFLRLAAAGGADAPFLGWNFCVFLVSRDGKTVIRPHASTSPLAMREDIERLLAEPPLAA